MGLARPEIEIPRVDDHPEVVTRRGFMTALRHSGMASVRPEWLPLVQMSPSYVSQRDVVLCIFMRGGLDGLSMCVPYGDSDYYRFRPTLAVPRPDSGDSRKCANLDGFFGLPPALMPLMEAWTNGHLTFVQATGLMNTNRSHFDSMNFMESGKANDLTLATGWLGRHLLSSAPMTEGALTRGIALSNSVPKSMTGGDRVTSVNNIASFGLPGSPEEQVQRQSMLGDLYSRMIEPAKTAALNSLRTIDLLKQINFANYQPAGGAVYTPDDDFAYALKSSAALIKAQIGVEAIHVDIGDWDTHSEQGIHDGHLFGRMQVLSKGLQAFYRDMFAAGAPNLTVVVMSEFGRNIRENGSRGTDHGYGGCMMLMGAGIVGKKIHGNWPGLHEDQQFEGQDLKITVDYRDILSEIVSRRLGNGGNLGSIFPDYSPTFRGVVKPITGQSLA